MLAKGDTNNSYFQLYTITEINNDKIPSYRIDKFNETLLKSTDLTLKEMDIVMKKLNLN